MILISNMKKFKFLILLAGLLTISCNNSTLPAANVTASPVKTSVKAAESPIAQSTFESFPETSETGTLEDKYDLQTYIESNNVLQDIPFSAVDSYKVRFTSDGGAVFAVKAEGENFDYTWKRTPQKLLFDNFQLVKINQDGDNQTFFSRYSQLIENEITVSDATRNFSKAATLVQTVGLSLTRFNQSYKIASFTPVVIRQVEKNNLPYKIDKITLQAENAADISLDGEKTLIPWPGISFNQYTGKKVKVTVSVSSPESRDLAVLASFQGTQYQFTKASDNSFSAEITMPELKASKGSFIFELIDQASLQQDTKFQGYTWIVPFVVN
jgi:hypothetical protein